MDARPADGDDHPGLRAGQHSGWSAGLAARAALPERLAAAALHLFGRAVLHAGHDSGLCTGLPHEDLPD